MCTHNICFHREIGKNIIWIPRLICSYDSSGSALFVIQYVNLYEQSDWLKIGSGYGFLIYSAWQRLITANCL